MPLSLPPPVASALSDLLLLIYKQGYCDGSGYAVSRIAEDAPRIDPDTITVPPELLSSAHMEVFLGHLELMLLDTHHRTSQSPLLGNIARQLREPPQASATFPPPLDSQDQF